LNEKGVGLIELGQTQKMSSLLSATFKVMSYSF